MEKESQIGFEELFFGKYTASFIRKTRKILIFVIYRKDFAWLV
jgi:hypothetical protein